MITEPPNGSAHQTHACNVIFAKDLVVGDRVITPASLGTVDATANGGTYQSHIIGFLNSEETGEVVTTLDFGFVQRLVTQPGKGVPHELVLQGEPGTGSSIGLSRVYVGITSVDGTPDFRSGIDTNGGGSAGAKTLNVDGVNARVVLSVGDQLINEDELEIGTVESINALGTTITFDKNGLLNTVANDKILASKSPIKLVLGFER